MGDRGHKRIETEGGEIGEGRKGAEGRGHSPIGLTPPLFLHYFFKKML